MKKEYSALIETVLFKGLSISFEKLHKSRRDLITRFIIALAITRSVQFTKLGLVLNDEVEFSSNVRRIQSFIADYELNYSQIAILIYCFLPKGKWRLAIDRTNWEFGNKSFNILAITVACKGVGIPIFFELLDNNGGNSNQKQRIDLLGRLIKLFKTKQIECIIGDREFIGEKWCKWLIKKKIPFNLRIKDDTKIKLPTGINWKARDLVYQKKKRFIHGAEVYGCKVNVALKKTNKRTAKGDWENLNIITTMPAKGALEFYKNRWGIEVFFQSVKSRGFNLEETHLTEDVRLKKLFAMVCITFAICLKIGIWKHENIKEIKIKSHGYKANSFFRYGLDHLHQAIRKLHTKPQLMEQIIAVLIHDVELNMESAREKILTTLEKKSFIM